MVDTRPPERTGPEREARPAADRRPVVALHCSGSYGGQWAALHALIGAERRVLAPDFFGTRAAGPWRGQARFSLSEEARPINAIIDGLKRPVHLVGHSYGGGIALRIAVERPDRVASLTLYEPSAFHVLKQAGPGCADAFDEIRKLAARVERAATSGALPAAAQQFVEYWNGSGAWCALKPERQAELAAYVPKARLDFVALFEEPTPLSRYRRLRMPVLLIRGSHAPVPTRKVVEVLAAHLPERRVMTIATAGHMGPITHPEPVNRAIATHIAASESYVSQVDSGFEQGAQVAA